MEVGSSSGATLNSPFADLVSENVCCFMERLPVARCLPTNIAWTAHQAAVPSKDFSHVPVKNTLKTLKDHDSSVFDVDPESPEASSPTKRNKGTKQQKKKRRWSQLKNVILLRTKALRPERGKPREEEARSQVFRGTFAFMTRQHA